MAGQRKTKFPMQTESRLFSFRASIVHGYSHTKRCEEFRGANTRDVWVFKCVTTQFLFWYKYRSKHGVELIFPLHPAADAQKIITRLTSILC